MSALVYSALLHYIPIVILMRSPQPAHIGYTAVISCSTTLSVVWHYLGEPDGALQYADYAMAILWSIYTLYLIDTSHIPSYIFLELFVCSSHLLISLGTQEQPDNYKIWHTVWHILSALKSMYFAWLLTCINSQYNASYREAYIPLYRQYRLDPSRGLLREQ